MKGVYFLGCPTMFKVGISNNINKRKRAIEKESGITTELIAHWEVRNLLKRQYIERWIHHVLEPYRIDFGNHREWFTIDSVKMLLTCFYECAVPINLYSSFKMPVYDKALVMERAKFWIDVYPHLNDWSQRDVVYPPPFIFGQYITPEVQLLLDRLDTTHNQR